MLIYSTQPWCTTTTKSNSGGSLDGPSKDIVHGTCMVGDGHSKSQPILKYLLFHPDEACGEPDLYPFYDDDGVESEQWSANLESELISVLAKYCRYNDVKSVGVFEKVVELVSDELIENGSLEFPTVLEVRHKVIRLRALFLEYWNFVVAHELPFEEISGKITTTPKYEAYIGKELELEEHFRLHGLPRFAYLHAIFFERNAVYLKEEGLLYYLRDERVFKIIDRYSWIDMLEEALFKWLVEYTKTHPIWKGEQLLEAMLKAAQRMNKTDGDVRRLIRRHRLPFLHFKTYVLDNKLEECWEVRKLVCCGAKHYSRMHAHAQRYMDSVNFEIYRLHNAFFVEAAAALTPEELEAHSLNLTTQDVCIDLIWRT